MKNSKRGVTPVIATIILIAGTLVLALVVGAYTFGLFGSNVKTVTLTSGNLFAGTMSGSAGTANATGSPYISMALNDPGTKTTISSFGLTGSQSGVSASAAYCVVGTGGTCAAIATNIPNLTAGAVTSLTLWFYGTGSLVSGQTYNYVISFANGQSVSGSLIAQ